MFLLTNKSLQNQIAYQKIFYYLSSLYNIKLVCLGVFVFLLFAKSYLAFSIQLFVFKIFYDLMLKFLKKILNKRSKNI